MIADGNIELIKEYMDVQVTVTEPDLRTKLMKIDLVLYGLPAGSQFSRFMELE